MLSLLAVMKCPKGRGILAPADCISNTDKLFTFNTLSYSTGMLTSAIMSVLIYSLTVIQITISSFDLWE